MHTYKDIITLNRNSRGCYILDTIKGCSYIKSKPGGCYGDCYANHIAERYGFDFSKPVMRDFVRDNKQIYFNGFVDIDHESKIIREIKRAEMPFIRIGEMGDPSENWDHTLSVCQAVSVAKKPIVIITKHWKQMSDNQLDLFSGLDVVFNTSVSALDETAELKYRLEQYKRLSTKCRSVLRVVTCAFNISSFDKVQDFLLSHAKVIDTAFRPSNNNKYLVDKIITAKKIKFLGSSMLTSLHDENIFLGYCEECTEQCGLTLV